MKIIFRQSKMMSEKENKRERQRTDADNRKTDQTVARLKVTATKPNEMPSLNT